jgi:hypothetical protein
MSIRHDCGAIAVHVLVCTHDWPLLIVMTVTPQSLRCDVSLFAIHRQIRVGLPVRNSDAATCSIATNVTRSPLLIFDGDALSIVSRKCRPNAPACTDALDRRPQIKVRQAMRKIARCMCAGAVCKCRLGVMLTVLCRGDWPSPRSLNAGPWTARLRKRAMSRTTLRNARIVRLWRTLASIACVRGVAWAAAVRISIGVKG